MATYFDIHTHRAFPVKEGIVAVQSFDSSQQMTLGEDYFFSTGIHPWSLPMKDYLWFVRLIERLARHRHCVAIGECGLDYKKEIDRALQLKVMIDHAEIAEKFQLPLIIHCVGAFHDLLKLKKNINPSVSWIVHGFVKSAETASQCIDAGLYLSVGKRALDNNFASVLQSIPLNRLFIESDDSEVDVISIYNSVAAAKSVDGELVKWELNKNVRMCFPKIKVL